MTHKSVALAFGCSISTVGRVVKRWRTTGQTDRLRTGGSGKIFTLAELRQLRSFVCAYPTSGLRVYCQVMAAVSGVLVSRSTLCRCLKFLRISRKRVTVQAAQRNQELRALWRLRWMFVYPAEMWVFVDETGFDLRSTLPHYGYGPIGHDVCVPAMLGRGSRYNACAAIGIDGYVVYEIMEAGATYNTHEFNRFVIEKVLPLMSRDGSARRSILAMDNAAFHKSPDLAVHCLAANIQLVFVPPYSPDIAGPIEESFSKVKHALIGNHKYYTEPVECITEAFDSVTAADARGWFSHAGYMV